MTKKMLLGASYTLGEEAHDYTQIAASATAALRNRLLINPEYFGLGTFYSTSDIYARLADSLEKTLSFSEVERESIADVIICSSVFSEPFDERNRKLAKILREAHLAPHRIRGLSGNGCAEVLSAIDAACEMLDLGSKAVIVLAVEAHPSVDGSRLFPHALLSDAAASMLICADDVAGPSRGPRVEIIHRVMSTHIAEIGQGMKLPTTSASRTPCSVDLVLTQTRTPVLGIHKVFGNNLYRPIKEFREQDLGFHEKQLFFDNIKKVGHCLACDPIVNFVDYVDKRLEAHYLLFAESEGHSGAALLKVY